MKTLDNVEKEGYLDNNLRKFRHIFKDNHRIETSPLTCLSFSFFPKKKKKVRDIINKYLPKKGNLPL